MRSDNTPSAAWIAGHLIFRILVAFPITCFLGVLASDLAYFRTAEMMWADFSAWLLAVGILMGGLAAVVGLIYLIANRHMRQQGSPWALGIGAVIVLCLALFNNLVHSRDTWTSVMPTGLVRSAATVGVMLITAWLGSVRVYRQRVSAPFVGAGQ